MKNNNGPVLLAFFLICLTLSLIVPPESLAFTISTQGLHGVQALAAGGDGSVALQNDGTVVAWGDNTFGQTTVPSGLAGVTNLATGGDHLLALKQDGTVMAWGNNNFGQATIPAALSDVTALAAGYFHSVALKGDGTVAAWGRNDLAQATVPGTLTNVQAIAAGGFHTVALKVDGTLVAWGDNLFGQSTIPPALSGVAAIAAGSLHTVALTNDSTVVAWGDNSQGQTTVPADLGGVVAIAAGLAHTVALKNDGTVVAWGGNLKGQSSVPEGLAGVIAIAAGDNHTLALKNDGSIIAWGDNAAGQSTVPVTIFGAIANGTVTCGTPVNLNANSTCTVAPNPGYHLATFTVNGTDRLGEVSNHTYTISNVQQDQTVIGAFALTTVPSAPLIGTASPANGRATVTFTPPLSDGGSPITGYTVTSTPAGITASGANSPLTVTGLTNGVTYTFSARATNAIGTSVASAPSNDVIPLITHKVKVQGLSGVRSIASGGRHTVALKNDGAVIAWGDNSSGQTTIPQALTGVIAVAAGDSHSVALRGDGTLTAWGDNSYGQTAVPSGLSGVIAIAAGWNHTLALQTDGSVVAWGKNSYGQSTVPSGLNGVTTIAAGAHLSVALKNDGTAIAWGKNGTDETAALAAIPGLISVAPSWAHTVALRNTGAVVAWGSILYELSTVPTTLSLATAISSGYLHSVALQDDGTVVAWGNGTEGQTAPPPGLAGVEAIAAGDNHTVALKADGSLSAWGDGTYGQTNIPAEISGAIANGTVNCTTPVPDNASADCTIVPSPGYHLATFAVNGVDRLADISNGNYTIPAIQQDQTVLASFATVPAAPTIGLARAVSGQAIVTFTPPTANGGSPITGYTVTANPDGVTANGGASPLTVSGLQAGTMYTFTVRANNIFGAGAASEPSSPILVYDPNSTDFDIDLVANRQDNCPLVANPDQFDNDYDGVGDLCDQFPDSIREWRDADGDGVGDNLDNCVTVANPAQTDGDQDARGDACDRDPLPNYGSVTDAPHNQTNGIACSDCHSFTLWWQYSPLTAATPAYEPTTNAICSKCHGLGGSAIQKTGHSYLAMGLDHRAALGEWQTKCVDCHDPHLQAQLDWSKNPTDSAKLYLITGTIGNSITVDGGQTTFSYTLISALPEWDNPLRWQRKNATLPPTGLILVDDTASVNNNTYKVLSADANTITVKGGVAPAPPGRQFGIIYGQMIKSNILTKSLVSRAVKFFNPADPAGGFTDGNSPVTGICQVCHQETAVWDDSAAGDNSSHTGFGNTRCADCHRATQGFAPNPN